MKTFYKNPLNKNDESILMVEDGVISSVPISEQNADYRDYLEWLAEGNTPGEWSEE